MSTRSPHPDRAAAPKLWTRRSALGCLALPLLAGCSSDPNSDTSQVTGMLSRSLDIFSGGSSLTLEQVAAVPYASIGVRVGGSVQGLLVLATQNRGLCLWTSASHIAIETRAGRILSTAGLSHDAIIAVAGTDPLGAGLQHLGGDAAYALTVDLSDRHEFQIAVQCRMAAAGTAEITLLGTKLQTLHAVEHCTCPVLGWNFVNEYWCDGASGLVWRSAQNVHPDLATIQIETLRPPA